MKILVDGQTLGTPELQRGIGKVFLEALYHMVDGDIQHDWYIAVQDMVHLERLKPRLRRWIEPVLLPALSASDNHQINWCQAYGRQLDHLARTINAEVYWNPNPLMPNVHYPLGFRSIPRVVTLYDLIPRLMPERFQHDWGQALWQDYLTRCDDLATDECYLLAISDATAKDFIKAYPLATSRVQVVTLASNYSLFWPYVQGDRLSDPPYVLYVGGFDPRKNMDNALRAFAAFAKDQQLQEVRFKVVCAHDSVARKNYFALARQLGVENQLDLLGYVDDEDLGYLFRSASIFFFPSLYEGFGLPVLDALACGLPVVASATSSIPEVGGEHAIYCDPKNVTDMAYALNQAWNRRDPNDHRRIAAVQHARSFRWEKTAHQYLQTFMEAVAARHLIRKASCNRKPRVAYLSPWPPQKTGVANYSYHLMPYLLNRMNVTLFAEFPEQAVPLAGLSIQSMDRYPNQAHDYDGAIYHLGNSLTHLKIYEYAWRIPGVVVLHDYNIHPSLQHGFLNRPQQLLYEETLKEYGVEGLSAWDHYLRTGNQPDLWEFPMSHPIARRSHATIVHSRWVAEQLAGISNILRVHLGADLQPNISETERQRLRQQLAMDDTCFWIGIFGFINQHKRIDSVMTAMANLCRSGYPIRLLVVGEVNDDRINLAALEQQYGLSEVIRYEGYVNSTHFLDYMKAVDVVANLRYPTMGESSASLYHALACGEPTLISDFASFSEIPDLVAWKAVPIENEIDQLVFFLKSLFRYPAARNTMSINSLRFIHDKASFESVAETYFSSIRN